MGKVFRARCRQTGDLVAIKALHKRWQSDDRAVARFVQESQILARLRHPNIVGLRGLGQFPSGSYFMVLDYIEGTDLQSRLERGPLLLRQAVSTMHEIATAIDYAHRQGVVHCDLKPANTLLDQSGRALVTDFGFAYLLAGELGRRQSIGGTAGYLAPEILKRHGPPTPAADIYSLGVLLSTLIAGATSHLAAEPQSDDLLARLRTVSQCCMEDIPEQRYSSAKKLIEQLESLLKILKEH
jgi:serine/threonine-protein kinase